MKKTVFDGMLPQLVLLPPLGHKKTIGGTLGIALFKTGRLVRIWTFECWQTYRQTQNFII